MNVFKHWFAIWGVFWTFWAVFALSGTMMSGVSAVYYIIPIGILIMGLGSVYYGRDWYK